MVVNHRFKATQEELKKLKLNEEVTVHWVNPDFNHEDEVYYSMIEGYDVKIIVTPASYFAYFLFKLGVFEDLTLNISVNFVGANDIVDLLHIYYCAGGLRFLYSVDLYNGDNSRKKSNTLLTKFIGGFSDAIMI
jgi:hypothetical protein